MDVSCEAYDHFRKCLSQLQELVDGRCSFKVEPLPSNFSQFLLYERIEQLSRLERIEDALQPTRGYSDLAAGSSHFPICCCCSATFTTVLRKVFGIASIGPDITGGLMDLSQGKQTVANYAIEFRIRAARATGLRPPFAVLTCGRSLCHVYLLLAEGSHTLATFIDSGSDVSLIDEDLAQQLGINRIPLPATVPVKALDGHLLGKVTHQTTPIRMPIFGNHHEIIQFHVLRSPGASCTNTCVDFLLKLAVRQNPETVCRTHKKIQMYQSVRTHGSKHVSFVHPNQRGIEHTCTSSLSTPPFTYANLFKLALDLRFTSLSDQITRRTK
ncbi:Methyltransferase-like protein 22 [Collichthys lucidus]|uniref:Methyltransferase-like protein 22 n=1 Tax=Collichthys lucidus TaxID=240159 RepID=A0A4U5TXV7_COLLU|nr:Methyltransferase-like protein 22 [Collichthys lucidus]